MSVLDWSVIAGGVVLTAFLMWYFFGPKKSRRADVADGVQEVTVTVRGGYSPDLVEVQAGMPVRLLFDRQERGDWSSRVMFPDFEITQGLPDDTVTAGESTPTSGGGYGCACGMRMLPGRLWVVGEPGTESAGGGTAVAVAERPGREHGEVATRDQHHNGTARGAVGHGELVDGVQVAEVRIRGGYHPQVLRLAPGVPAQLVLVRQENGACSERFTIPALDVDVAVPAFGSTVLDVAARPGGRDGVPW